MGLDIILLFTNSELLVLILKYATVNTVTRTIEIVTNKKGYIPDYNPAQ